MKASSKKSMSQDVSCLNSRLLLDYVEHAPNLESGLKGDAAVKKLLAGLVNNPDFLIRDPINLGRSYPVELHHLRDPRYWHSIQFSKRILANAAGVIGGHRPLFQAGIPAGYHFLKVLTPNRFQLARLFKVRSITAKLPIHNARFNRIKQPKVLFLKPGHARIAMNYFPEYRSQVSPHMCDWTSGIYMGGCKFTSAEDIRAEEIECVTRGDKDCIFEFRWVDPTIRRKLLIFVHNLLDPEYIHKRDFDNLFLSDANLRQETIIKERTAALKASQKQLLAQERIITEQHIAGGMAHEIRNALGAADVRFKYYDINQRVEKNIDRLQQIIHGTDVFSEKNEDDRRAVVAAVRGLFDDQQDLKQNLESIKMAIHRGLKITGQVLDYAKLSTHTSESSVDVCAVIDDLALSYGEQLADLGIDVLFDHKSIAFVKGHEAQLHIVFQNLMLNSRDAILEKNVGRGTIRITIFSEGDYIVITVEDDGIGISSANQSKIFYPFFTTKPNRGIGLGLCTCEKIVRSCNGHMSCDSSVGRGTVFTVRLAKSAAPRQEDIVPPGQGSRKK